ncbi:helix-turn-helix domain-containing protein [Nonomuraea purpurea]|uniref:Helix-turn-helix domain-containing protein n=1 Tax=Nonomuraea purpurea TaxID=1849276 RepID=A0ABV8G9N0_9ACTN
MSTGAPGSTVPRRQLGRYLRELRNKSRLTVRAAAMALEWSEAKLWRIETGQTSLRSLDVAAMCNVYGAPADLTEALKALAKETKARGWWHAYGDVISEGFDLYIGLEEAASQLSWYESELIPGLLQTPDYARTLIEADNAGVDEQEIERRVRLRMERQQSLTRRTAPPTLHVVLNEGLLRRPIGGRKMMAHQLDHLTQVGRLPNVTIKVMSFSAELHPGVMSGPFVILRFPLNGDGTPTEPPTIYVDGYTGALYLDKPNEVERYSTAFDHMWASALNKHESLDLISEVARSYE